MSTISNKIFHIKPIRNKELWKLYKIAESSFWKVEEIDFSKDKYDWNNKLNDDERYLLSRVLSFFAQSDFIVNINLEENFLNDIKQLPDNYHPYTQIFYDFQKAVENIHSETYGHLLQVYISDEEELNKLKDGINTIETIKKKAIWAEKWINDKKTEFPYRLIAFAALEGIFFSGSFCVIFWLRNRNILLGLIHANKLISKDEGLHFTFACELYNQIKNDKLYEIDESKVLKIIIDAVEIEKEFIIDAFKCRLLGINDNLMGQYIEFITDRFLNLIGLEKYYNVDNPFPWMESISLENKTNFFEKRVAEYSKVLNQSQAIELLIDF